MLHEYTISFWVYPEDVNDPSTFINLFERVRIYADNAYDLFFEHSFSNAAVASPVYTADSFITANTWNYVAASLREISIDGVKYYEMQLAVARGRSATVMDAGHDDTVPV